MYYPISDLNILSIIKGGLANKSLQVQTKVMGLEVSEHSIWMLLLLISGLVLLIIFLIWLFSRQMRKKKQLKRSFKNYEEQIISKDKQIAEKTEIITTLEKEKENQKSLIDEAKRENEKMNIKLLTHSEKLNKCCEEHDYLLDNSLPESLADMFKNNRKIKSGEYHMVSLLLISIDDFPGMRDKFNASDMVNELDTYIAEFEQILQQHSFEKVKTWNNKILSVGGLKQNTRHPIDAAIASLELQRYMQKTNRMQEKLHFPVWKIRTAIHYGKIIAGVAGKKRLNFDIWGSTFDIVEQIENNAVSEKVIISEDTYHYIKDYFNCSPCKTEIISSDHKNIKIYMIDGIKKEFSLHGKREAPNSKLFKLLKEKYY